MSGVGKTTVAGELLPRLQSRGVSPVFLDGDALRAAMGIVGNYDPEGRHQLAFVYARLCSLIARQGHIVVCSTIALFHDVQTWNRAHFENYIEVFLDVPLAELARRNSKELYGGNGRHVVGMDVPAEFPLHAKKRNT